MLKPQSSLNRTTPDRVRSTHRVLSAVAAAALVVPLLSAPAPASAASCTTNGTGTLTSGGINAGIAETCSGGNGTSGGTQSTTATQGKKAPVCTTSVAGSTEVIPCISPVYGVWSPENQCYLKESDVGNAASAPRPAPSKTPSKPSSSGKPAPSGSPSPSSRPSSSSPAPTGNVDTSAPTGEEDAWRELWRGKNPSADRAYYCNAVTGVDPLEVVLKGRMVLDKSYAARAARAGAVSEAWRRIQLQPVEVGSAPTAYTPDSKTQGAVGLPVWLWAANKDKARSVGPVSLTDTIAGETVHIAARVDRVEWDMGDGTVVTCHGAGTPYSAEFGTAKSPDCGYEYSKTSANQPGGVYTVKVTTHWKATWKAGGDSGELEDSLSTSVKIKIGELQTLNER